MGVRMRKIHINSFAKRQTSGSRFSHFEGSDDELIDRVDRCFTMMRAADEPPAAAESRPAEGKGVQFCEKHRLLLVLMSAAA